jgi:hypothetical protein
MIRMHPKNVCNINDRQVLVSPPFPLLRPCHASSAQSRALASASALFDPPSVPRRHPKLESGATENRENSPADQELRCSSTTWRCRVFCSLFSIAFSWRFSPQQAFQGYACDQHAPPDLD